MDDKRDIACKILDYWSTMEFLSQDSYESCTGAKELTRELHKYLSQNKVIRMQLPVYASLNEQKEIYPTVKQLAKECKMKIWGNLTFYVGKVGRQHCIESLAKLLENRVELKQAEKNTDEIALFSFQCDQNGVYMEHSLSLSPLIWSLSRVKAASKSCISEFLSETSYASAVNELEKTLFASSDPDPSIPENESIAEQKEQYPPFDKNAITVQEIYKIQDQILGIFSSFLPNDAVKSNIGMRFQLFRDSKAKEKYNDDNYMGLSHDFFSNDLKLVQERIQNSSDDDLAQTMLGDLINYICAPYSRFGQWNRHDLVHPDNRDAFTGDLLNILDIRKAPLGKWPSRYMPVLMQQAAINLAINNGRRKMPEEVGKIFSVNGPPGTGKTTLLKEIVAENVVEKARLLSQYDTPDNAFEGHRFVRGEKNGAYSIYIPKWFSFKNNDIANYGILVTSCNNAAVENITKELPLSKGISNQLKATTTGDYPDSSEMQKQLQEVAALFSTESPSATSKIDNRDSKRSAEHPEIYFTDYAGKLLGTEAKDADAWGLIAVPLGKKKNIDSLYFDVLCPLLKDYFNKNIDIYNRLPQYEDARKQFLAQLRIVEGMRDNLAEIADSAKTAWSEKQQYQQLIDTYENRKREINTLLQAFPAKMSKAEVSIATCCKEYNTVSGTVRDKYTQIEKLKERKIVAKAQATEFGNKALEALSSITVLTKIFRPSKRKAADSLAKSYENMAQEAEISVGLMESEIQHAENELKALEAKQNEVYIRLNGLRKSLNDLKNWKNQMDSELSQLQKELDEKRKRASDFCKLRNDQFAKFQSQTQTDSGFVIDDNLISDVLTDDQERSTAAQLFNPWVTQRYNREREKLFYFALQMTKMFLLSSKCCRANLCILGQYWGLRNEKDTDRIIFHAQDRRAMMGSLLQTLFLLTPVVSSTFASVGNLLRDITEPGVIGTLIVDEAGQAQPQMAVGALYRSRRAIVVGDPKQVEPVVTDELNMLKATYSEKIYSHYKDKSLSVQTCADVINPFGTFFENGTDYPDWVGCPLLVHRRCISPMYDISNQISYDGIMKQKTLPPAKEKTGIFLFDSSKWINVVGSENGHGDHYVSAQGTEVCSLVNAAFKQADFPNLYIIAPFNKVVQGIRNALMEYAKQNTNSALAEKQKELSNWVYSNIGTVHKFQGKEADEVIFLLGCDISQKDRYAVSGFVNGNLVNVAVTRAKYRLYVIGDAEVWQRNRYISTAKAIMDTLQNS